MHQWTSSLRLEPTLALQTQFTTFLAACDQVSNFWRTSVVTVQSPSSFSTFAFATRASMPSRRYQRSQRLSSLSAHSYVRGAKLSLFHSSFLVGVFPFLCRTLVLRLGGKVQLVARILLRTLLLLNAQGCSLLLRQNTLLKYALARVGRSPSTSHAAPELSRFAPQMLR